jgi:simple sugar transport system substrate-binding protein
MSVVITRRTILAGGAAAAATFGLSGRAGAQKQPVRVGFIYVGPVGDYGWSYQHDVGRKAIEAKFGDKVKTTYVENVSEGPDAERVIRELAARGQDIVFTTSFGFMNPTIRVAKQFPNVKFEHATGYQRAPNVATYNVRFYEGRAVIGTIAGHMTKSGIVGYIGSVPIPEVAMGINAFTLAAQKIRPDIQVKVVWVNSWYDPGKEADAAKTLIDQGADMISQHTDSPAPLQVAENRGVYGFGQASDMRAFAPKAQLTAIVDDWNDYYISRVQAVMDGTWKSHDVWNGLASGMVKMAPYGDAVPANVREAADSVKDAIIARKLHPFTGPIKNQSGQVVIPEGKTATDEQLAKMDWFVQGVQGKLGG